MGSLLRVGLCVSLVASGLSGCGARAGLYEPAPLDAATAPDIPATPDIPAAPDISATPDIPATPDVTAVPDGPVASVCGNARVEAGEGCDLGPGNGTVWAFSLRQTGRPAQPVTPLRTNGAATAFYGYRSASAHTGFEALGVANLMLHVDRNTQSLSLVFMAGIDGDLGGAVQPASALNARVSGLPPGARLLQSDDPGECDMRGDEVACDWDFRQNSDGLVVGPLPWDQDWAITLAPDFRDGVSTFRFQNGDARAVALLPRSAVTLEFRAQRPACRDDCTLPRCGDGRLDGGERCDDGNTRSGDGCRADCQRIE